VLPSYDIYKLRAIEVLNYFFYFPKFLSYFSSLTLRFALKNYELVKEAFSNVKQSKDDVILEIGIDKYSIGDIELSSQKNPKNDLPKPKTKKPVIKNKE
jgi:hypothetical protein